MRRNILRNKKAMSIVISTIIIAAIAITMAIAVSFWAMGISNAFTKFEKLEIISGWVSDTTVPYGNRGPCYQVSFQIKNTGTNTATINNLFLDGKPYTATSNRVSGNGRIAEQTGLIPATLQTGVTIPGNIFLPTLTGSASPPLWNSGEYVTVEFETAAGRHYAYTVVIP